MNQPSTSHSVQRPEPISIWERWAFLFGRLLILLAMVYVPLVYYGKVWRHYHSPKTASGQFLMMLLVVCWLIIAMKRRFIRSPLATPVSFFFLFAMISTLFADQLTEAWETNWFLLACMVFMLLIPKFLYRLMDFRVITYLLGIMCLLSDLYALAQFLNWTQIFMYVQHIGIYQMTTKPVGFMGNENYTAEFLNMIIPICAMMIFCYRKSAPELIFFSIVMLFNAVTMTYIDCNASYVGFAAAIPVMAYLLVNFKMIPWVRRIGLIHWPRRVVECRLRHCLIVGILLASIGVTAITSLPNPIRLKMASMASWVDMNGDMIPDGVAPIVFRLQCMDAAMRNIKDAFFFGIGAGNFKVMHPLYESQLERKVLGEETLARKVHNDHLYHACENGVFGLFSWYWIIATVYFCIIRSLKYLEIHDLCYRKELVFGEPPKKLLSPQAIDFYFFLQLGILGGLTVALASTAFGHTFVISSSAITFWILSGVSVAVYQVLYFAQKGIRFPQLGTTQERLTPVQAYSKRIPDYSKYIVLFLLVLPLGAMNTYQYVGELFIYKGINDGGDAEKTHDFSDAIESFDLAMKYYPYQMEIYYILGRYYIDAIVALENALYNGSAEELAKIKTGYGLEDRKRLNDEGIVILQTDIFMNPNYKWAHNNLGVLYDRLKDYYDPNSRLAHFFKAPNDPDQVRAVNQASLETYYRVLQIDKEQVYAHFNLGLGAMKDQHFELAVDELNRALMVDPLRYDIYRYLAACFLEMEDFQRAMMATNKYMSKVILLTIQNAIDHYRIRQDDANVVSILKSLEEGDNISAATKAKLVLDWTDDQISNIYLTIAFKLAEKVEKKDLAFEAARLAEITQPVVKTQDIFFLSQIYQQYGDFERTAAKLEEYLRIDPNKEEVLKKLGEVLVYKDDLAKSEEIWQKLIDMRPKNWTYMTTLARVRVGMGKPWDEVTPLLYKAIEFGKDDARRDIAQTTGGNNLQDKIKDDPQLQQQLGPEFYKPEQQ